MFIFKTLEVIGMIAFAISGAVTGIEKKLDLFGVTFLAIVASVGGGIFRDIVIGVTPPTAFVDPKAVLISIATALVALIFYRKIHMFERVIRISDALGLGVFTAIGCQAAMNHGAASAFLIVAMGLSTGVGGGMVRDLFVRNIPFVLRKEIYAVASICGALAYVAGVRLLSADAALIACSVTVFLIRMVAVLYKVNLPTVEP